MKVELEHCEVECGHCGGYGFLRREQDGYLDEKECDYCHGTGKLTRHDWKTLGATSRGVTVRECQRCWETEEEHSD